MSQLLIRNVDQNVKERLRERARRHGRSLEAEARAILEQAAQPAAASAGKLSERLAAITKTHGLDADERLDTLPPFRLGSPFNDDHR